MAYTSMCACIPCVRRVYGYDGNMANDCKCSVLRGEVI